MDEECVGVPSSGPDDRDEGGVEVPGYAPARIAYRAERCIHEPAWVFQIHLQNSGLYAVWVNGVGINPGE